jgi:hypothetical protein
MKRSVLLACLALGAVAHADLAVKAPVERRDSNQAQSLTAEDDEYRVWEVVLLSQVAARPRTPDSRPVRERKLGVAGFDDAAYWSYLEKPDAGIDLSKLKLPFAFIRYERAKGAPRTHYAVGRVGFNSTRTQAAVSLDFNCMSECGQGSIVLLEKKNGAWTVIRSLMTWVS